MIRDDLTEFSGAVFNLWIDDCPPIRSYGHNGKLIRIVQFNEYETFADGLLHREQVGTPRYEVEFTVSEGILDATQIWFTYLNTTDFLTVTKPTALKFKIVGTDTEPMTPIVALIGAMKLVRRTISTSMNLFDFHFFNGRSPLDYVSPVPNVSPTPSISASASHPIPVATIASEEDWSESASIAPDEDWSYSPSGEIPDDSDADDGPNIEEKAEQLEAELKMILAKIKAQKEKEAEEESKEPKPKRKVTFL
jgi:hypothetical protein